MTYKRIDFKIFILIILLLFPVFETIAQDTTKSLAFKKNRPVHSQTLFYHPDIAFEMWQNLNLVKEANSGNALAMHELGIRYIIGDGVPADTVKAAYWIGKAAKRGLTGACYNYAILLNNGWGIKWNPFTAYNFFKKAAQNSMPQAEYIIGLMYTDNLIVERNWSKAYLWVKKSAQDGYAPAKTALANLTSSIDISKIDTSESLIDPQIKIKGPNPANRNAKQDTAGRKSGFKHTQNNLANSGITSSPGFVFIDFSTVRDTSMKIPDKLLVEDLMHQGNEKLIKKIKIGIRNDSVVEIDSASIKYLKKFADDGSPEALTFLGRLYQKGQFFKKDLLKAAVCFIRAIKLDSPRSPLLLWKTVREKNFYTLLKNSVNQNNPEAMFVWYGIYSTGFDNQIVEADALKLLVKAASMNYLPAVNELGLDYYTGKYVKRNREKAVSIWNLASDLGSKEAELRLSISQIYGSGRKNTSRTAVDSVQQAVKEGSVLAQATLAYCYQHGIGIQQNLPDAVKYYRFAAQRGSQFAYNQLKQLYDNIRPDNKEFQIN